MRYSRWPMYIVLALVVVCACGAMNGQSQKGSIRGTVSDSSKAVIQGARVVISPGNAVTSTNASGEFTIGDLAPGLYTITITSQGFTPLTQSVSVTAGPSQIVNPVLQVGSAKGGSVYQRFTANGGVDPQTSALAGERTQFLLGLAPAQLP